MSKDKSLIHRIMELTEAGYKVSFSASFVRKGVEVCLSKRTKNDVLCTAVQLIEGDIYDPTQFPNDKECIYALEFLERNCYREVIKNDID